MEADGGLDDWCRVQIARPLLPSCPVDSALFQLFWEGFPFKVNQPKKGCPSFPMEIHWASESMIGDSETLRFVFVCQAVPRTFRGFLADSAAPSQSKPCGELEVQRLWRGPRQRDLRGRARSAAAAPQLIGWQRARPIAVCCPPMWWRAKGFWLKGPRSPR